MRCTPLDKVKQKQKKGLWSPDEDQILKNYILRHGYGSWSSLPINAGLQRNGKSCRLRWINYLRPGLKRGAFTKEEEDTILALHQTLGNKWSQMANHLPGRTDNEIKNHWHSYLKKRLEKKVVETQIFLHPKPEITTTSNILDQIQCFQSSSPSSLINSTTRNSSFESFENIEGYINSVLMDTQVQKITRTSLPKVIFAEWLSTDHEFRHQDGQELWNSCSEAHDFKSSSSSSSTTSSGFQDCFVQDHLLLNEGMVYNGFNQYSQFKFEDEVSESCFAAFFQGEFNINL